MLAQQSKKNDTYTAQLPFGSTQKHKVMTTSIVYARYRKILFQKVASGYLLHSVRNRSSKNMLFLVRVLRIDSVQSVINNPTQLSGIVIPCIFYVQLFVINLCFCLCSQMEAGPCNCLIFSDIVVQK